MPSNKFVPITINSDKEISEGKVNEAVQVLAATRKGIVISTVRAFYAPITLEDGYRNRLVSWAAVLTVSVKDADLSIDPEFESWVSASNPLNG